MTGSKSLWPLLAALSLMLTTAPATHGARSTVNSGDVSKVFQITVADKNASHPFYGMGHSIGFVVDGIQGKALLLTRGKTYIFDVKTNVKHDFYLSTSPLGRGAGTVTQGVSGQFTYRGMVFFTPSRDTPDIMYYQCRNHPNMGGPLYIVSEGEAVDLSQLEAANKGLQSLHQAPDRSRSALEDQVRQKIDFAALLAERSEIAGRIEKSDLTAPRNLLRQARVLLAQARQLVQQSNDLEGALADASQAIELIQRAQQQLPSDLADADQEALYGRLRQTVNDYNTTYHRERDMMVKKKGTLVDTLDQEQFRQLMGGARQLAEEGRYAAANEKLQRAENLVTNALSILLDNETVLFAREFSSPRKEYEWESARHQSYVELIPLAIEQKRPTEQTVRLMNQFVSKSIAARKQAKELAQQGDYRNAILATQAATDHLRTALRLVGL
ncbi:MAG: hypothetical protein ACE5ET_03445 [Gammaproteobacteria bacterium]